MYVILGHFYQCDGCKRPLEKHVCMSPEGLPFKNIFK